jgi:hypothetical protein
MPPRHHTTNAPHDTAPHVHVRDKQNRLRDREGGRVSNRQARASRHTRASQRSRHSAFALDSLGKPLAKHGQVLYSSLATPTDPPLRALEPLSRSGQARGGPLLGLASRLPDLARISSSLVGKSVTSRTGCPEAAGYALEVVRGGCHHGTTPQRCPRRPSELGITPMRRLRALKHSTWM